MTVRLVTLLLVVGALSYSAQVWLDGTLHALLWGG